MADPGAPILFCLPFAGGSSYSYREFQRYTDDSLRIAAIDLPGRGRRFGEPLLKNLHAMADDGFDQIRSFLNNGGAYALYGHSMGAWIAYLLVKRIIREGCPLPRHLFVSGREAPCVRRSRKEWHLLPPGAFLEKVKRYGGMADEVAGNQELMELFEPVLRADFQALDAYTHEESLPFDVPVTAMWSNADMILQREAVRRWREETSSGFSFLEFDGGHFFIFRHAAEIVQIFTRCVASPCATEQHAGL